MESMAERRAKEEARNEALRGFGRGTEEAFEKAGEAIRFAQRQVPQSQLRSGKRKGIVRSVGSR